MGARVLVTFVDEVVIFPVLLCPVFVEFPKIVLLAVPLLIWTAPMLVMLFVVFPVSIVMFCPVRMLLVLLASLVNEVLSVLFFSEILTPTVIFWLIWLLLLFWDVLLVLLLLDVIFAATFAEMFNLYS